MLRDYLRLSMKSLRRRSLRSWLTILGIVIGVAAVVALIAIGEGMQRSVEQQFNTIGYNTIILGEAAGKALIPETRTPTVPNRTFQDQGQKHPPYNIFPVSRESESFCCADNSPEHFPGTI